MSLGDKLDRLRGRNAGHYGAAVEHAVEPGPQDAVDKSGRRSVPDGRRLAAQWQAEELQPGLLVSETLCPLSGEHEHGIALTGLPEVHALPTPDWVYLDTETTGLSGGVGNLAFMVGVARREAAGSLRVRQYTLAGFSAEKAMLQDLRRWLGGAAVLVSFNGKCFDLPLLVSRLALHRLPDPLSRLHHLDLMYSLRRAYRKQWPDCRLQTAERLRMGFRRVDDLPGAEAPAAWRSWLQTGNAGALSRVLAHNLQDVVSLAVLHGCLVADYSGAGRRALDHGAVGRAWMRAGQPDRALQLWQAARDRLDDRGLLDLASAYRRRGRWRDAEAVWLHLHRRGNAEATLALSKYHEHQRRDPERALGYAIRCVGAGEGPRVARLEAKSGRNLSLPLEPVASKASGTGPSSAVRSAQALPVENSIK